MAPSAAKKAKLAALIGNSQSTPGQSSNSARNSGRFTSEIVKLKHDLRYAEDDEEEEEEEEGEEYNEEAVDEEEDEDGQYFEDEDDSGDDQPFLFRVVYKGASSKKSKKRRLSDALADRDYPIYDEPVDSSDYRVEPKNMWNQMQSYKNFVGKKILARLISKLSPCI